MTIRSIAPSPVHLRAAISLIAALCVGIVLLPSSAFATGASANGGATFSPPPITAPDGVFVGKAATIKGHVDTGAGRYAVSAKLPSTDWLPVTNVNADSAGDFSFTWKAPKSGQFAFRVTPAGAAAADSEVTGSINVYRRQKTTWYGPGFYGGRTACGKRLTRRTIGVAHRTLKCGTRVEFFHNGRKIVVPVIDRGPFVRGVHWDLTLAAMKRLGSSETIVPGVLPLR